jgi:uncharacterized protein YbbK (DUF523 family)
MIRLRIGISSCLLGDEVRFDGGHKRHIVLDRRHMPTHGSGTVGV